MAKQDPNPPKWEKSMGDGCSGVVDWLPFVGDMSDCCNEHDRAYHYGGGEKDFLRANEEFKKCIQRKKKCWFCHKVAVLIGRIRWRGVDRFGRKHFNWLGPGLPKGDKNGR